MSTDIIGARDYFPNLSLSNYLGQRVGNLSTTALKLIKIMKQVYAPPVDIGSKMLLKLFYTFCDYFNWRVFT